ncbi:MAG: universal stress protein [Polaromonas sp.]|uniref:universal stress protein n=1 Tax=Polaromonas sp. TaxID=1869339 RepID=UPI00326524A3
MKLLLAADGSKFTDKALAFISQHKELLGTHELLVVNVQPPVHGRVTTLLGSADVAAFHTEESNKVLGPIKTFLAATHVPHRCIAVIGSSVQEIISAASNAKVDMIVMGTHGHGWIGRALMGSVAQRVVADSDIPVLLVK